MSCTWALMPPTGRGRKLYFPQGRKSWRKHQPYLEGWGAQVLGVQETEPIQWGASGVFAYKSRLQPAISGRSRERLDIQIK